MLRITLTCGLLFSIAAFAQAVVQPEPESKVDQAAQQLGPPIIDTVVTLLGVLAVVGARVLLAVHANAKLAHAMTVTLEAIGGVIKHLVEGLAPDVKAALANDGVIDPAERGALISKGLGLLKAELPAPVLKALQTSYGQTLEKVLISKLAGALDAHIAEVAA